MIHATDVEVRVMRAQAIALADRPDDLVQRASVYRHLYRHSGGNHIFPLLAAHGAMGASGYFRRIFTPSCGIATRHVAVRAACLPSSDARCSRPSSAGNRPRLSGLRWSRPLPASTGRLPDAGRSRRASRLPTFLSHFRFRGFGNTADRIDKGLAAYDGGEAVG